MTGRFASPVEWGTGCIQRELMSTNTFELECTDCEFTRIVQGDAATVFDTIESHQTGTTADGLEHFVTFARREEDRVRENSPSD